MEPEFLEFREELRRFLRSRVRNDADAEDLVQDVFLKLAQSRMEPENPRAYLYSAARSSLADFYRRQARDDQLVANRQKEARLQLQTDFVPEDTDWLRVDGRLASCLRSFADELAPQYRDAVLAVDFDGLAQKEFARRLGEPYSSVKSRVQEARRRLASNFLQCCEFAADEDGETRMRSRENSGCDSDCGS